ncbi:MAG: CidA/LrgA family protein [Lachnospiraceae bacterium]|nr:CidA/LrgA family protein [Lachnospiraceae bacterium]
MKYLKQFGIIITISFIGEILHHVIPLTIPASVYGIVLMFLLLLTKAIPLEAVKETAHFLIKVMPIMFVPAAVGLMDMWGIISVNLVAYVVLIILTTLVVMVVSGLVSQKMIRRKKEAKLDLEVAES